MEIHRYSAGSRPLLALVVLAAGVATWYTAAEATAANSLLTGVRLQKRLAHPVDLVWSAKPLGTALRSLSQIQDVAVLLDRRVDPGQEINLSLPGVPLEGAMRQMAESRKLGVTMLGPVAYFGPPGVTSRLRTIAAMRREAIDKLPAALKRKFLIPRSMAWHDFATPRGLLEDLAAEEGLELFALELVPHDLWAGAKLAPAALCDRLTLILVQFDLTFQVAADGRRIKLVPLPDDVSLVRSYPAGSQPSLTGEKLAALAPDARVKVVGDKVWVKGLLEDHERITAPARTPVRHTDRPGESSRLTGGNLANKRFTLTAENQPIGALLKQLAAGLGLELRIDYQALREAGVSMEAPVSFSVEKATVDGLLRAAIKSMPLRYRRVNNVVEIGPLE